MMMAECRRLAGNEAPLWRPQPGFRGGHPAAQRPGLVRPQGAQDLLEGIHARGKAVNRLTNGFEGFLCAPLRSTAEIGVGRHQRPQLTRDARSEYGMGTLELLRNGSRY